MKVINILNRLNESDSTEVEAVYERMTKDMYNKEYAKVIWVMKSMSDEMVNGDFLHARENALILYTKFSILIDEELAKCLLFDDLESNKKFSEIVVIFDLVKREKSAIDVFIKNF